MKTKLITALRATASALESGTFDYHWDRMESCNCGSLFCALTGKSAEELDRARPDALRNENPTWQIVTGQYCPITGIPTHELFRELFGYGLSAKDIVDLEFLRNEKVTSRFDLGWIQPKRKWYQLSTPAPVKVELNYKNKQNVIRYMRAWADLLTEEGRGDVATEEQVKISG